MTASDRIRKLREVAEALATSQVAYENGLTLAADARDDAILDAFNEAWDAFQSTFDPPTVLALLRVAAAAERHVGACGYTGTCSGERPDITAVGLTRALDALAATGDGQGGGEEG